MNASSYTFSDQIDSNVSIAVILPAYNEELTIEDTIRAFNAVLPLAEIWVVNNRSLDATESLARNTLLELNCLGGVINENRQGKGNAVRRAFLEVDADIYVLVDADMTYPAYRVHDLIAPIFNGSADMVVGDRHSEGQYAIENKRALHGFGNNLVKLLVNWLFKACLKGIMSGYRVFSRRFVKNYPILIEGFEIETDVTLHALDKRFRIIEIPVEYQDRPLGSFSKLNTFSDGTKVLFTIAQILRYYRPLLFFGCISVAFFFFGLLAGWPAIVDWVDYRYVYHVPLAILAAAFQLGSFMALGIGMILDSITHQNKMAYERDLLSRSHFSSSLNKSML